jgi:chemotaxis protein methyltransferase CheR
LHLRWPGFRKVRRQVLKRIARRLLELGLASVEAYRTYLEAHPAEWAILDDLCWIGISRFYRDRSVYQHLAKEIVPNLAQMAIERGEKELRCWSAGCAAGEEPYTLAIIWKERFAEKYSGLEFRVVATDVDPEAIQRGARGCYPASSVKELPAEWRERAFSPKGTELCLKDNYRALVTFTVQDIREQAPDGLFHLILCRNLAFTYFDDALQRETLRKLTDRLVPGGALIIGKTESLPGGVWGLEPWSTSMGVYRKPLTEAACSPPPSQV